MQVTHPEPTPRRRGAAAGLVAVLAVLAIAPAPAARTRPGRYDASGIDGSGAAIVQPVTLGVRVGLVGAVPGDAGHQAWAVGRSTAKIPGWAGERGGGQAVFLRYTRADGWRLNGPPVDARGRVVNPTVTAISMASDGSGWAVGGQGSMLRLANGRWVATSPVTEQALSAVSIGAANGVRFGFAVGGGRTVLRLAGDRWTADPVGLAGTEGFDFLGVAAVSPADAWIAGSSGRGVLVLRRTARGWTRVATGSELFDREDGPRRAGTMLVASARALSVAATSAGAWVGGSIVPADAGSSLGDPAGDPTRPFVLHAEASGEVTTFCPDRYSLGSEGGAQTETFCDEPFPLSAFGISALAAFPGPRRGEAFAAGLGLFHYRNGSWFREPNPLSYLTSLAFVNRGEGWLAGSGATTAPTGAFSTLPAIAHWTRSPEPPHMARHPQPVTDASTGTAATLESVAVAPDASGRALAVGQSGALLAHRPGVGWDSFTRATAQPLHGVAWASANDAWAVGGRGTTLHFDGTRWRHVVYGTGLTNAGLFAVAFAAGRGYAVGSNGTILRFDGTRWRIDAQSRRLTDADLFAVAAAGGEFVAAGAEGTLLETRGGRWRRVAGVSPLLARGGLLPSLYTVAGLPDGTAVAGGESSTLIRRDKAAGAWRVDHEGGRVPPEGTILAVAARRTPAGLELVASVSDSPLKYAGDILAPATGQVLHGTSRGWRDLDHTARQTLYDSFDASAPRDPVYSIAFDGSRAWAVGGIAPGNDDGKGHVNAFPTSSVYRIDPYGDPHAEGYRTVPSLEDRPGVISFAFFGESSCGAGLCGMPVGSEPMADVVASQIRDEVNAMARLPGGPAFALFGGNFRGAGIPEELGQFKAYADGFEVPFFAALGGRELFSGLQSAALAPGLGDSVSPDDAFFVDSFRDRPRPWGERPPPAGFVPVLDDAATRGARTHYAFDYAPSPERRLRIVVLDDSAPARLTTAATQNPPRDQVAWLTDALRDARTRGIPAIIVMNRPARNPLDLTNPESAYDEALPVQAAASNIGASAVLTSYFRQNSVLMLSVGEAGTVPVFAFGGGGAPLESKPSASPPVPPDPSLGYYHSWQLVTVDTTRRTLLGQAEVSVKSYPVVDTLALHAIDGATVPGGNTLRFTASGRAPQGGGPADPLQSRAAVVPMDFRTRGACPPDPGRNRRPICRDTGSIGPHFLFASSDPRVGFFVTPSAFDERFPYLDPATGLPVADPTSGLFCAVGAGTTLVGVVSGFHRALKQVTVTGGEGPCVKRTVVAPPEPPKPRRIPEPEEPAPIPRRIALPVPEPQAIAVLPPPPVPIVAPAPPIAGGYARKEKHEANIERAGEMSEFRALPRGAHSDGIAESLALVAAAGILGVAGAVAAARRRNAAAQPARAWIEGRRR